jgi:hypothetical protein
MSVFSKVVYLPVSLDCSFDCPSVFSKVYLPVSLDFSFDCPSVFSKVYLPVSLDCSFDCPSVFSKVLENTEGQSNEQSRETGK